MSTGCDDAQSQERKEEKGVGGYQRTYPSANTIVGGGKRRKGKEGGGKGEKKPKSRWGMCISGRLTRSKGGEGEGYPNVLSGSGLYGLNPCAGRPGREEKKREKGGKKKRGGQASRTGCWSTAMISR